MVQDAIFSLIHLDKAKNRASQIVDRSGNNKIIPDLVGVSPTSSF